MNANSAYLDEVANAVERLKDLGLTGDEIVAINMELLCGLVILTHDKPGHKHPRWGCFMPECPLASAMAML